MPAKLFLANVAAAVAALTAGTVVVVTSVLVNEVEPASLAGLRYIISLACLAPILPFIWPKRGVVFEDVAKIAGLGVLFFGIFPWAFTAALSYTTPARGAIGLATMPIQTLLVAALLSKEAFTRRNLVSVLLGFTGIAVVFGPEAMRPGGSEYIKGDLLMLFGVLNSSLYIVLSGTMIQKYNALFITTVAMFFGVIFLFLLAFTCGELVALPSISREGWYAFLFIGIIGGAIQFVLFIWALGLLPPTRAALFLVLSPISAMFMSVFFLGEAMTLSLVLGMSFVLFGIYINNRRAAVASS